MTVHREYKGKGIKVQPMHATSELRVARLKSIQEYMGLSKVRFASLLKTTYGFYLQVDAGRKNCPMYLIELAEIHLARYKQRKYRHTKAAAAAALTAPSTVSEIQVDPAAKARAVSMYIRGKSKADIASALALRPEVVDFYLNGLDE